MDRAGERARTLGLYLEHIRALPFVREVRAIATGTPGSRTADIDVEITTKEKVYRLSVDEKRSHLGETSAFALAAPPLFPRAKPRAWLVAAPTISRATGERLVEHGWNYVDRAGNCHVDLDGRYVAHIEGRTTNETTGTKVGRALRSASYRVLFAMLADPGALHTPLRAIAEQAGGVSAQTVSDLRAELAARGLVESTGTKYRWNPGRLGDALDLFVHGYLGGLRENLIVGRFRAKSASTTDVERAISDRIGVDLRWAFGGGAAAMHFVPHFRGDVTIVHIDEPPDGLAMRLGLVPDVRGGNVVLQRAIGSAAFRSVEEHVVHPLLAYADLVAEGDDRALEAARMLRHEILESGPR